MYAQQKNSQKSQGLEIWYEDNVNNTIEGSEESLRNKKIALELFQKRQSEEQVMSK